MTNNELTLAIIRWATESKNKSTSPYVDTRQDQIITAAQQVKPEGTNITERRSSHERRGEADDVSSPRRRLIQRRVLNGVPQMSLIMVRQSKRFVGSPVPGPNTLSITTQPSSGPTNDSAFAQQPVIQLRDAQNVAIATADIVVTAALATGNGTLGGTLTATTNGSGVATFTNLKITGLVGARTIQFTAPSFNSVVSGTVTTIASAATKLSITTQPSGGTDDLTLTQQPVLQLRDVSDNLVSQASVTVTAAIQSGSGSILGDTTKDTNGSGVATFTDLGINGTGNHVLRFTASGLTLIDSGTLNVAAAGGGSAPTPSGTFAFDTRAGGAQSWQAMSTIGEINAGNGIRNTFASTFFVADVDGTGTKARGCQWVNNVGQEQECFLSFRESSDPSMYHFATGSEWVYYQGKYRFGKSATGGGNGTIDQYSLYTGYVNAHTKLILMLRAKESYDGPNPDRIYNVVRASSVLSIDARNYNSPNMAETYLDYPGTNQRITIGVQGSTGSLKAWRNDTLVLDVTGQDIGNSTFDGLQITVTTWPNQEQVSYDWDHVCWKP